MAGETGSKSGTLSFSVTCSNSPGMITGAIIQQIVSQTWHPLTGKTLRNINMVMFMFWPPQILKGINPSQRLEPRHIGYSLGYTQLVAISFLSDLSVRWRTKTLEYLSKHIQKSKASADKRLLRSESIPAVSSCCCNERQTVCRSSARPMDTCFHTPQGWRTNATSAGTRHQLHPQRS